MTEWREDNHRRRIEGVRKGRNGSVQQDLLDLPLPDMLGAIPGAHEREVRTVSSSGGEKGSKGTGFAHIPPSILLELGKHYGDGAVKYKSDPDGLPNFWKGYPIQLNIEAFWRHFLAWCDGEELIPDDGTDDATIGNHHLAACIWHLIDMRHKVGSEWDDRPSVALRNRQEER
jgi:hypothetical protein